MGILLTIPFAASHAVRLQPRVAPVSLAAPRLTPPPVLEIRAPRLPKIEKTRPVQIAKIEPPRFEPRKFEPPKIEVEPTPSPKLDLPAQPAPVIPVQPRVQPEVFAAAASAPVGARPAAPAVQLGGFGDPNGVRASDSASTHGLTIAKTGSFDLPVGSGHGGAEGKGRVIASAGFGDTGGSGANPGSGRAPVRTAGFEEYKAAPAGVPVSRASASVGTPVEITYKPKPVYSSEARERKLEGEVQLEVVFCSTGQIHVLRVVHGLGFGLDESASAAASRIQFRPGTKDGVPVDMKGIVHIVFQLS